MQVDLAYTHRSTLHTSLTTSALDFAANMRRAPVSFRGRVREPLLLRQLMSALHEVITSDMRWISEDEYLNMILDPVITVHHDQIFFEAFSNDESSYVRLSAAADAFEVTDPVSYGTTNIDFTWQLRHALNMMRSSRHTDFTVGAGGFGVATSSAPLTAHFERKVDLPDTWLKGFLQVQSALTMHPFLFDMRPTDLLTIIAFLAEHKPPGPPHGLRYEFLPNQPVAVVLEPWEQRFTLKGTHHTGYERTVRLWGRRRLSLLQGVLPYTQRVTVGILGRGLPHFYICHCGNGYQFALVLSGWTSNDWARGSAFDLLAPQAHLDDEQVATIYACLNQHLAAPHRQIVSDTGLPEREVDHILFNLCRAGRVMYDPTTRSYRLRELFAEPLDIAQLFAPDPRIERARQLLDSKRVTLHSITHPEPSIIYDPNLRTFRPRTATTAPSSTDSSTDDAPPAPTVEAKAEAEVSGVRRQEIRAVGTVEDDEAHEVTVAVDASGRLRFGRCTCPFFAENLMARGPCEHILALRFALEREKLL
jgi:hypothetical protein